MFSPDLFESLIELSQEAIFSGLFKDSYVSLKRKKHIEHINYFCLFFILKNMCLKIIIYSERERERERERENSYASVF